MVLIAPYKVGVSFSKKEGKERFFVLNLNQYRNEHYQILNKAKIKFKEIMKDQINQLPKLDKIQIRYVVYPPTNQRVDISNVCSVVDKFFSDSLVELGVLIDDNWHHLPRIIYDFGAVDSGNPRIEIFISDYTNGNQTTEIPIEKETNTMQVTLNHEEVMQALRLYAVKNINIPDDFDLDVKLNYRNGEATGFIEIFPEGDIASWNQPEAPKATTSGTATGVSSTRSVSTNTDDSKPKRRGRPPKKVEPVVESENEPELPFDTDNTTEEEPKTEETVNASDSDNGGNSESNNNGTGEDEPEKKPAKKSLFSSISKSDESESTEEETQEEEAPTLGEAAPKKKSLFGEL